MARGSDVGKLDAWRQRLAKFGASGLSVSAFCRQENIAPARFYYWSRQVRENGSPAHSEPPKTHDGQEMEAGSTVDVFIGTDVMVRLPGSDRELIKLVLSSFQCVSTANAHPAAFQRIDFNETVVARR